MNIWAVVALIVIIAGIVLSAWRQYYYTIVASITCVVVYAIQQWTYPYDYMALTPNDLTDPGNAYTLLTSMYAHDPDRFGHLLFNVFGLALIGLLFEQRIRTRPFILLYLLSGLAGTSVFAVYFWNEPYQQVLGASGAISGVLGGFARLYPNEKMSFIFLPGVPMRMIYVVFAFVALQLLFISGPDFRVAWQAHLGGLAAGILLAPFVVRLNAEKPIKARISTASLQKLAVTPELRDILRRIESEEVEDVRKAWVSHFMSKAKCPKCGASVKISGDGVRCSKGHML